MDPATAFGKVLNILRKRKNLSQETLAFESGLQRNYISLLELGQRTPTLKTIIKLSDVLEIRPSKVVALTEKKIKERTRAKGRARRAVR
ncbi:MAG TPA: helix-turn-helix transcriptional regulator [Burkholderiales bacterium]|nr:helix-turn-helix transcriptional regulator [Burkholderiales bacterium]